MPERTVTPARTPRRLSVANGSGRAIGAERPMTADALEWLLPRMCVIVTLIAPGSGRVGGLTE